jgi:hypothetical protein
MRMPRVVLALATLFAVTPALSQSGIPNYPTGATELRYYNDGPWAATMTPVPNCLTKPLVGGLTTPLDCEIYHPASLGTNPDAPGVTNFEHPVILWGNGTGAALPGAYSYLFEHLASWGFVVIRTTDATAGNGQSLLDARNYLAALDANPASAFHGRLDLAHVGAAGHSQGAAGAINAMNASAGAIRTAVTFHLPFNAACVLPCVNEAALTNASQGSIFFVSGTLDLISRDTQLLPGTLSSNTAFYNATPAALAKAKAMLVGGAHNDVTGSPNCVLLCNNGVHGYLGYPTAWLMWQLRGASDGHDAFRNPGGEIFQPSANWQGVVSNIN